MISDRRKTSFFNVFYTDVSEKEFLNDVAELLTSGRKGAYMVSLNVDQVVKADKDPNFAEAFNAADFSLMDGVPLIKIARHRGLHVAEKISGSDLIFSLCKRAANEGWTCFVLGGRKGVPERACENLSSRYPGLKIVGAYSPPYGFENDPIQLAETVRRVSEASPDICFVCLGEPKQTKLAYRYGAEMGYGMGLCLGAAVDFAAGSAKRAPRWMQVAGLEWLYRFLREPRRLFRRYFIDSWRMVNLIIHSH